MQKRIVGPVSGAGIAKHAFSVSAWATWNGSGTPAIIQSHRVSSLTDNGVGDYTITWLHAFSTATYACASNGYGVVGAISALNYYYAAGAVLTASATRIGTSGGVNTAPQDNDFITLVAVGSPHFGELNRHEKDAIDDAIGFWAHWTIAGGTPTLAESWNVSSLTDNGIGDITINIASALNSANYVASGICTNMATASVAASLHVDTTTAMSATVCRTQAADYFDGVSDPSVNTFIGFTYG